MTLFFWTDYLQFHEQVTDVPVFYRLDTKLVSNKRLMLGYESLYCFRTLEIGIDFV